MFFFNKNKKNKLEISNPNEENSVLKAQLNVLSEISGTMIGQINLDDVINTILTKLVIKLGYSFSGLFLLDDSKKVLNLKQIGAPPFVKGIFEKAVGGDLFKVNFPIDDPDSKKCKIVTPILDRKISISSKISDFSTPKYVDEAKGNIIGNVTGIKYLVGLPIIVNDIPLGTLIVATRDKNFVEQDTHVLQTFANQISIAIYNARLFTQVQNQVIALTQQNHDLASLYNLTSQISKTLDPEEVAQNAVNALPQDESMIGAVIQVYDEAEQIIYPLAVTENPLSYQVKKLIGDFKHYPIYLNDRKFENNPTWRSIKYDSIEHTEDLGKYLSPPIPAQFTPLIAKILNIKSVVVYPLHSRNKVVANIGFFLKSKVFDELNDNERQLLQTYANQIAIALENSSLYRISVQTQASLEKALDELQERRQFEQDMVDIMGHELRTPMSIVRNSLSLMEIDLKNKGEISIDHQKKYVEMGMESARREVSLIETLLSATKADAKGFQLLLDKVDLAEVIRDSIEGNGKEAEKKGLQLIYTPLEKPVYVYSDRTRIQEVMDNFLSNAVKYTEKGSISILVEMNNDFAKISIKDTGIGISPEDLKKLGQKFFRAQQYTENDLTNVNIVRPGGTGLGLYVAFSLIKVMDGKLDVQSKLGEGSTFIFSVPLFKNQKRIQIQRKTSEYPGVDAKLE